MRKPCVVCDGKTSRTGKSCASCGKLLPVTPWIPNRKLPKGQHKAKRKVAPRVPLAHRTPV